MHLEPKYYLQPGPLIRSPLFRKKPRSGHKSKGTRRFQQIFNSLIRKIRVPEPEMKIREPKRKKRIKLFHYSGSKLVKPIVSHRVFSGVSYSCIPRMSKRVYCHILRMSTLLLTPVLGKIDHFLTFFYTSCNAPHMCHHFIVLGDR